MTKYLVFSDFDFGGYFVDPDEPSVAKKQPFDDAFMENFIYHYFRDVELVPRISFVQDGSYYRRVVDTVWSMSFEDWSKQEGNCYFEDIDETTRRYFRDTVHTGWFVERSQKEIKSMESRTIISTYYFQNNQPLNELVIRK